jgi:MFS family permease
MGGGMSLLLEDDPSGRGLRPDGDLVRTSAPPMGSTGASVREAIRSRRFIGLYAACLVSAFGLFVPFVHLVPYALDHGLSSSAALLLISAIGVGSTAGRFILGGVADRMGRSRGLMLMFAGLAIAFLMWAFSMSLWSLTTFAIVYGIFYGGFVALLPALVMDYFGGKSVSSLVGILYSSVALGTLVGPSAAGFAFDLSHSYLLPIVASMCANIIAIAIVAATSSEPGATSRTA